MKPELKKLSGNLRGFSLKDKKLSRKGFRGVSRQVLSAFRRRIRWVYPGGLSFSIFLSRWLSFSRPSNWARTVLRPPPVGDMRPLPVFPAGRSRAPCPPNLTGGRTPALIPFPLLPHFLPRALPPSQRRAHARLPALPLPGIAQPPSKDKKSGEELPFGSVFSAMSGHGFHGP